MQNAMVLFLNDIAGSEIILILVFVLIFFGSKSIPGIARTMGRTMRQIKDASADLQSEIRKSSAEMKKDLNLDGLIKDTASDIKRPMDQYTNDIENAIKYHPSSRNSHISSAAAPKPEVNQEAKEIGKADGEGDGPKPLDQSSNENLLKSED